MTYIRVRNTINVLYRKVLDAYFAEIKIEKVTSNEQSETSYTIKKGDTLSKIATKKKTTVEKIIELNDTITQENKDQVIVGQEIKIVTQSKKKKITFKEIDSANLGDEVYVIIKTDRLRDEMAYINVLQGKEKGLVDEKRAIMLHQNGKDLKSASAYVGAFACDDETIENKDDFKDWAVLKFTLGAKDNKEYSKTLDSLPDKKTFLNLLIDIECEDGTPVIYNGRNPDKNGKPDPRSTPNFWLDFDGGWFELKKKQEAPWMKFAIKEYNTYSNIQENTSPLKEKIEKYFDTTNAKTGKYTSPWCGAFVNWCFEQTKDYKGTNSGLTALAFDWGIKGNKKAKKSKHKPDGWKNGEECKAFYGAVIVLNYSHVAFIVGKNSKTNKYVYIGGNQGGTSSGTQKIQYGSVKMGNEFMIMKPKKHIVSKKQEQLKEYSIDKDGSYNTTR